MKISRIAIAAVIALNLIASVSATTAVASTPEFDIPFPTEFPLVTFATTIDIEGFAAGDPVAIFNMLVPPGGGILGSLTIYSNDPAKGFFDTHYDYDLTIDGVPQTWDSSSQDAYRYLFDVPLTGGTHAFFISLKTLLPGQLLAPTGTTAWFVFLYPGAPVPVPIPATGVLLIGALFGIAGLRKRNSA